MKSTLLKISILATILIFLSAGASWAHREQNKHYYKVEKKHYHGEYHGRDRHWKHSHKDHRRYDRPRRHYKRHYNSHRAYHKWGKHYARHHHKYHRPAYKHDRYCHKRVHKHYRKHKPYYNSYSVKAPAFDRGWSIIIKTKSRW